MKITIQEIKERYLRERTNEKRFVWTYYVRRPISYYIAWFCIKLGISANSVTLSFLFVGIIGCLVLTGGNYLFLVVGAVLIELSNILDCVDGHIARLKGGSYVGTLLDSWSGEAVFVSSMFSLGIGLSKNTGPMYHISHIPVIGGVVCLYVGFFAAFAALSAWAVRYHWFFVARRSSPNDLQLDGNLRESKAVMVIDNLFHYTGAYAPLMVVSTILGVGRIFLILVFMAYGSFLLAILAITLKRAYRLDSK